MMPDARDSPTPAARYWDEHREKSRDPEFWMAHPLCRQAINRRVSGSPNEWPLDWFRRVHAPAGFERGVSFGCGLGAFERSAVRCGLVRQMEAIDVSPASLEAAREETRREAIDCIHYSLGDFDAPRLPRATFDIAFFHASLHHVSALERLFRELAGALVPGGWIYFDEYVGPSRDRWSDARLRLARALLGLLPSEAKISSEIPFPIQEDDPSEAVRSEEIPAFFRAFFDTIAWRPYGGQIVDLLFPRLVPEWTRSEVGHAAVAALLEIEEDELAKLPDRTHHAVACGRLKKSRQLSVFSLQLKHAIRRSILKTDN